MKTKGKQEKITGCFVYLLYSFFFFCLAKPLYWIFVLYVNCVKFIVNEMDIKGYFKTE